MHRINDSPGKRAPARPLSRSRVLELSSSRALEIRGFVDRSYGKNFARRRKETIAGRDVANNALPDLSINIAEEIPRFRVLVES